MPPDCVSAMLKSLVLRLCSPVASHSAQDVQHVLVAWIETVEDQGNHDPLPAGPALFGRTPPELALALDDVADVLHYAV